MLLKDFFGAVCLRNHFAFIAEFRSKQAVEVTFSVRAPSGPHFAAKIPLHARHEGSWSP